MLTYTTLGEKLKDLRVSKQLTTEQLSDEVGIPTSTLNGYENDEKNKYISYPNLVTLAQFYRVSTDYLLGCSDVERHLNQDVHIGLNDDTLDLLASGTLNTRLICEIMLHERFPDLLANLEIYIDSLARTQIDSLNAVAQLARDKIKDTYNPQDIDYYLHTLEAASIKENRYFQSLFHEDLDSIADDLRQTHRNNKKDLQVAKTDSAGLKIIIEILDKLKDFDGTSEEAKSRLFFIMLGLDMRRASKHEIDVVRTLIRRSDSTWKKK